MGGWCAPSSSPFSWSSYCFDGAGELLVAARGTVRRYGENGRVLEELDWPFTDLMMAHALLVGVEGSILRGIVHPRTLPRMPGRFDDSRESC